MTCGDIMAENFARMFYASKEWRALRRNLIIERGNICACCGKVIANTSLLIGHHKISLTRENIFDCNITLNPQNIEIICFDCHNKEHRRYGSNGHDVYIVYGSPLSGKGALVNQLFVRGDLILDIDKIYQSISGMGLYDKPNNLRFNVFAIRDKIIDMIKTRYGNWNNAYIIGGYPNKEERERLARELGAEVIYCEATKEECYKRALKHGRYSDEWIKYIDKWWANMTT